MDESDAFIIADYGSFIEEHPVTVEVIDVHVLPHSKARILEAILSALARASIARDELPFLALTLAQFQADVGVTPLYPEGINWNEKPPASVADLADVYAKTAEAKRRYDLIEPLVEADRLRIQDAVSEAQGRYRLGDH